MRHLLYSIDHLDMRGREPHRKCRIYYDTARFLKTLNGLDDLDADVSVTARVKIRIERPGTFLHARGITQTHPGHEAMTTNGRHTESLFCPYCGALVPHESAEAKGYLYCRCLSCRRTERLPDFKRYDKT